MDSRTLRRGAYALLTNEELAAITRQARSKEQKEDATNELRRRLRDDMNGRAN